MILTVYLNAKTKDELVIKQSMMNTLSGKNFKFRDFIKDGNGYTCWFDCDGDTWKRVTKIIEERIKKPKNKVDK